MRGALQSTLAAVRAYRRSGDYRQRAADASWARLAKRDGANIGAYPLAGPDSDQFSGASPKSRVRRSLIALGVPIALVAGLIAVLLGVSELNQRAQPGVPYSAIGPHGTAPASSANAAAAVRGTTGPAPAAPLADTSAAGGPATTSAGVAESAGSTSGAVAPAPTGGTPAPVGTAGSTGTPSPSAPSGLLDLCRSVVAAGNGWPSVVKGTDRATVIAAAGSRKNVLPYCTALVNSAS